MPWIVGIDEAGYGPNLGPLVQAAVAMHLPDDDHAGWETLRPTARRCHEDDDGRLLIDDSKKVYTRHGFAGLERTVLVVAPTGADVAELLHKTTGAAGLEELARECWFQGDECLPFGEPLVQVQLSVVLAMEASLVPAPRFNAIVDQSGSKGTVTGRGLVELMTRITESLRISTTHSDSPIHFVCDKQGGRNFYASMIQAAFPDAWVMVEKESAAESRYRIDGEPPITAVFRPRADGDSACVALASMLCKYLREVCMRQFNRFWAKHVPGLEPTAGYPGDARRFYDAIRPAMAKLGLKEDHVWRKK